MKVATTELSCHIQCLMSSYCLYEANSGVWLIGQSTVHPDISNSGVLG